VRLVAVLLLSLATLVVTPKAVLAQGAGDGGPCLSCGGATVVDDGFEAVGTTRTPSDPVPPRRRAIPEPPGPGTWKTIQERMAPTCFGNRAEGGADALCNAAFTCGEGRIRFWIWHRTTTYVRDADGNVSQDPPVPPAAPPQLEQLAGTYCLGADDPGVPDYAQAIAETMREFRNLPLPKAEVQVSPAPTSLVNVPTAFYAGGPQTFSQTVTPAGISITVTARPTAWRWTWGDGSPKQTFDTPGVPKRPVVAHTYDAARDYTASVEVLWRGQFTLFGQTYDIPTPAVITSPPVAVQVREARTQLVDR
jgi:hypothetical protein